jgi:Mn-containing catalase
MFYHDKRLQYYTRPERPDAIYAKKVQKLMALLNCGMNG